MNIGEGVKTSEKVSNSFLHVLIHLRERILAQLDMAPKIMEAFIDSDIKNGFVDQRPTPAKSGPHITSTAQCLRAIFDIPFLSSISEGLLKFPDQVWTFFEANEWKSAGVKAYNAYSAPLCLIVASKLGKKRKESQKIDNAIRIVISDLQDVLAGKEIRKDVKCIIHTHGFILYWTIRALREYWNELTNLEREIVNSAITYVENSLYKQLAYYFCDTELFDISQLAYYLLTCIQSGKLLPQSVVNRALDIIMSTKIVDVPKLSSSFLHSPEGPVMYCMSIEIPTVVSRVLLTQPEELAVDLVKKYFEQIEASIQWVELNRKNVSGYIGWRSDRHPPEDSVESWASALVFEFLYYTLCVINKCIQKILLTELNAKIMPSIGWNEIIDYKIENNLGVKEILEEKIIKPIISGKSKPYDVCGIILFGPPRTGKNTIVYALANRLNWKVVYLTPKDFLVNGPDNLIRTADEIFRKLMLLEDVLIFFDEIDTLITPREPATKETYLITSFTASMLRWLEDLKRNGSVIFVVCTNYLQKFEAATTARFDLILPIGPPRPDERAKLIKKHCPFLSNEDIEKLNRMMDKRMTIKEILEICEYAKEILNEKDKITLLFQKVDKINKRLIIDDESMRDFEDMIKKYAKW